MHADDTSIFIQHKDSNSTFKYAQMEVNSVAHWLSAKKLSLNIGKTKYTFFFIRTRGSFFAQNLRTILALAEEQSLKFWVK